MRWRLVVVVTAALVGCGKAGTPHDLAEAARAPRGEDLRYVEAQLVDVPAERWFVAVVEAPEQATISAQVAGRIVELPVDVNDTVRAGDVLARLRDAEQRARLDSAQARLQEAQAEFDRVSVVYQRKLVARAQMDRVTAARDAARATVDVAREETLQTVVRAPFAGVVTSRPIDIGELAQPGKTLATMVSLEQLRAIVDVPRRLARHRNDPPSVRVMLPGGALVDAASVVPFPETDPRTHTVRVRVHLPDAGHSGLQPGELVKVVFADGSRPALVVESTALVYRGEVTGVYVMTPDRRIHFRAVRTGPVLSDGRVIVVGGLAEGEAVAVDPDAAVSAYRSQEDDTS